YANDDEELTHGRRIAVETLEAECKEQRRKKSYVSFTQLVLNRIKNPEIEGVYVCCFCTQDDLSQWRAYGANGTGVSIKFSAQWFRVVSGPDSPLDGLIRLWTIFSTGRRSRTSLTRRFGSTLRTGGTPAPPRRPGSSRPPSPSSFSCRRLRMRV